jgi:hypothetical protein
MSVTMVVFVSTIVVVVIAVIVAPGPILFLLAGRELAEVAGSIVVSLIGPPVIVDDLVIVPDGIVGVVGIVYALVVMFGAGIPCCCSGHRRCQQKQARGIRITLHPLSSIHFRPDRKRLRESDHQLVARGKYIVDGVAICGQCHTLRTSSADLERARWLEGAPLRLEPAAPTEDWPLKAPRIAGTPPGSDSDLVTLLTTGSWRGGQRLRPPMPHAIRTVKTPRRSWPTCDR